MNTRITELLGIEAPIIQGAMARIADASLAGAVSAAGGLGIIACGGAPLEWVEQQVAAARKITGNPIGANVMLMDPNAAELARLLVDLKIDVITTGATLHACAQALLQNGAESVFAVSIAASELHEAPSAENSENKESE